MPTVISISKAAFFLLSMLLVHIPAGMLLNYLNLFTVLCTKVPSLEMNSEARVTVIVLLFLLCSRNNNATSSGRIF